MKRIGFTLIELLVVISIIAILAAIIVPATMRAKDAAYRSSDMSHMNELRSALQLYRIDQGGYPPALLGYVTLYATGPKAGQTVPANLLNGFLFPRRVPSLDTLRPAYDKQKPDAVTNAVWPQKNPAPSSSDVCAHQAFGTADAVLSDETNPSSTPLQYYQVSGFDVAQVPNPDGSVRNEIHYALFWTGYGLNATVAGTPCSKGSINDDPRQLGYANPPDDTVITWNTFFRDYDNNHLALHQNRDIVLFLGGGAKNYDSGDVQARSWDLKRQ